MPDRRIADSLNCIVSEPKNIIQLSSIEAQDRIKSVG